MRKFFGICMAVLAVLAAFPAEPETPGPLTAADLFVAAPTVVIPSIDRSTRLDMIDYFNAGSPKASRNQFGGDCAITAMTPEQVTFTTSAVGETSVALLDYGGKPLVMVINTVRTPGEDSRVKFYDSAWQPVRKELFRMPSLSDWMRRDAEAMRADLENAVPFMLVGMSYDPASNDLVLTNNVDACLPEENRELAGKSLLDSITYHWNGKRFIRL